MKLYGALEAGGTKMVCAIGGEDGSIIRRVSIPTRTPEKTMPEMIAFFENSGICALGIGCFGPIDLNKKSPTYGYITSTPKLAWQNYDVVGAFQKALAVPVGFDTDVNAAALGEATFGCTRDVDNSIYITIGTGIGVGVIINGKPLHGAMHPEGGHILLAAEPSDPMPRGVCPFHSCCFEGLAAGPSLEKRWGRPGFELADRREVWELEAAYIGQALCNYAMLLSPERIVLGGGVMHQDGLFPLVRKSFTEKVNGYLRCRAVEDAEKYICPASLNDNQGVMGCIVLAKNALAEQEEK